MPVLLCASLPIALVWCLCVIIVQPVRTIPAIYVSQPVHDLIVLLVLLFTYMAATLHVAQVALAIMSVGYGYTAG